MVNKLVDNVRPKVRNLLDNNWNNSNLNISSQPDISTGTWDDGNKKPQVTVTDRNDTGPGTATGYDIMTPSGPGSSTTSSCVIRAHAVWNDNFRTTSNLNPKDFVQNAITEADRIIRNNFDQMADFNHIGTETYNDGVDVDSEPTRYWASIVFLGWYQRTP